MKGTKERGGEGGAARDGTLFLERAVGAVGGGDEKGRGRASGAGWRRRRAGTGRREGGMLGARKPGWSQGGRVVAVAAATIKEVSEKKLRPIFNLARGERTA